MKNKIKVLLFLILQLTMVRADAVIHQVQFGGAIGFAYSPREFSASTGDTVQWSGDFTEHPLSSTSVPASAPTWHNGTGNVFRYVIQTMGKYEYQCDVHFGMTGEFTVLELGTEQEPSREHPRSLYMTDMIPNPSFDNDVAIRIAVLEKQRVALRLYTLAGNEVLTLIKGIKEAGFYRVLLPAKYLASGVYMCRLEGNMTETRRLLSVR
jgi:plastocyanin